jgi:hypothetical protein
MVGSTNTNTSKASLNRTKGDQISVCDQINLKLMNGQR